MHYVNEKRCEYNCFKNPDAYNELEKSILNILNTKSVDNGYKCTFDRSKIALINDTIYALSTDFRGNSVIAYEIKAKKNNDKHIILINKIADFNYLNSILHKNNITLEEFKEMKLFEQIKFIRKESNIYYQMFPEKKANVEMIDYKEYVKEEIY